MVDIDYAKPLYLDLAEDGETVEHIIQKLIKCGFKRTQMALLEAGTNPIKGDYVARIEKYLTPPRLAVYRVQDVKKAVGGYTWDFEDPPICTSDL